MRPHLSLIAAVSVVAGAALAQEATDGQSTEDAAAAGAEQMMSGDGHMMGHDMGEGEMMGHGMGGMMMSDDPGMQDLMAPMQTMTMDMPMESTGDVDADFLLMMIPHHQSAIDMARVVLEQGDDEETRAMAQAVIDVQEAEIAQMRTMLERMGVEPPAAE